MSTPALTTSSHSLSSSCTQIPHDITSALDQLLMQLLNCVEQIHDRTTFCSRMRFCDCDQHLSGRLRECRPKVCPHEHFSTAATIAAAIESAWYRYTTRGSFTCSLRSVRSDDHLPGWLGQGSPKVSPHEDGANSWCIGDASLLQFACKNTRHG